MNLPELKLIPVNQPAKEADYIEQFEKKSGRSLAPADPMRLLMSVMAGIISGHEEVINDRYRQCFLSFAKGSALDVFGADVRTERLQGSSALAMIEFTLSEVLDFDVVIPSGIRVSSGEDYIFATNEEITIEAGSVAKTVTAICNISGSSGNGFVVGQINQLVDPLPYVKSAVNITESDGGADVESDDAYRKRIQIALESFSVAGPEGAYVYHALSAHQDIVDVTVTNPEPGAVNIYPLLKDGEPATKEIRDKIFDICNAESVRPLSDIVEVIAPGVHEYDIDLTYYITESNEPLKPAIELAVIDAVDNFAKWQYEKLGRHINTSKFTSMLLAAGASRVEIRTPVYTSLTDSQVAVAKSVNIAYGGFEND